MAITMDGLFVNGQKVTFHPENIISGDASVYTEEIGAAVEAWLEENVTGGAQVTDTTLTLPGVPADAKKTGDEIGALKEEISDTIEQLGESTDSATFTEDLDVTDGGVTVRRLSDNQATIYGTATAVRHFGFLNGQHFIKDSSSAFVKTLDAGTYYIESSVNGVSPEYLIRGTYTTFSNWFIVANQLTTNGFVTFDAPVMIAFTSVKNTVYGTEENPTIITFTAKKITAKDPVARAQSATAVQYSEQTLTDSQQEQARINIDTVGNDIIYKYNFYDTLKLASSSGDTYNGITYTKNSNGTWTIDGTAEGLSFRNLIESTNAVPRYIIPGRKYKFLFHGGTIPIRLFIYKNGSIDSSETYTEDFEITIPEDIGGIILRFQITSGTVVDNVTVNYEFVPQTTDTTLTLPGVPADAKKVGEELGDLSASFLSYVPKASPIWMSGTVAATGAANATDTKRIRNSGGSSMPRVVKGDVIYVAPPYQARVIAYNESQLSTNYFYAAIQSDFVSGLIPIADDYIGKYLGIAIKDSTQEDADISSAISTIGNYVKIYRPGQYFDNINELLSDVASALENVNKWIMAVDTESEDETGKTDMAPAITAMLTETGYCHLGEGIFYVSGIDMPEGSTLCGCGYKTEIRLLSSVTSGYAIKMNAYNNVYDLRVTGSYATPTISTQGTRSGIAFIANFDGNEGATVYKTEHCMLHDVWISKFQNSGIYCHNTSQTYRQGLHANNVFVSLCWCGINIDYNSEFNKFVNVLTSMCVRGCMNNGGNNVFTSCTFYGTKIAFYVDGTQPNSAHGTINGCTFCHAGSSQGSAITMTDVTAGFVISDCQIHYNSIDLTDCYGISFVGCEFGRGVHSGKGATINIDGGGLVLFSGCMFMGDDDYPPEITITDNTKVRFNGCYGSETGNSITA